MNGKEKKAQEDKDHSRSVLFIHPNAGVVSTGIEAKLKEAGFNVVSVSDEPDKIIAFRYEADIVIYYPVLSERAHIALTMNLLAEICQDDSKIFCLTGDGADLKPALESGGAHRISHTYYRPVDMPGFIEDMNMVSELLKEYHRRKTLFVVDDDPDYLEVLDRWLAPSYNISALSSGEDLIKALQIATPDLILMDYEMPGMDGYELIKNVRSTPSTQLIPIIFLTGKNDRDHVMRILEYKPDGYLLKTSQKEILTDAINRFFSEILFRNSLTIREPAPQP